MSSAQADAPVPQGFVPFGDQSEVLMRAGWHPFPLPYAEKDPPLSGVTGHSDATVKATSSVTAWREAVEAAVQRDNQERTKRGHAPLPLRKANTGVRLAPSVVILDVDHYDKARPNPDNPTLKPEVIKKRGFDHLEKFREDNDLPELPPTLRLTSRGYDNPSGHLLYRLPESLGDHLAIQGAFPPALFPKSDVDILRFGHRYTVAPGSVHPDGSVYRLYDERRAKPQTRSKAIRGGLAMYGQSDIPELPEEWVLQLVAHADDERESGNRDPDSAGGAKTRQTGVHERDDAFPGPPRTEEERQSEKRRLDDLLATIDDGISDEYTNAPPEILLSDLSPSLRERVEQFDNPHLNNNSVPAACIAFLATLIEDHAIVQAKGSDPIPAIALYADAKRRYVSHGSRKDRPYEFDRAAAWAISLAERNVLESKSSYSLEWAKSVIEDDFWKRSEALESCRTYARAYRVPPYALLGAALAIVCAHIPPHVVLPPLVGSEASLNSFFALTGESGSGKSASMRAAARWLEVEYPKGWNEGTDSPEKVSTASGEGLINEYTETILLPKDQASFPGEKQHVQRKRSVLFEIDEIGTLAATTSRSGATLIPFLKSMWGGDFLKTSAAEIARVRKLDAHSYRTALVAGVQPELADVILDDEAGGFPQRWIWIPVYDPGRLSYADAQELLSDPEAVKPLQWKAPLPPIPLHAPVQPKPSDDEGKPFKPGNVFLRAQQKTAALEAAQDYGLKPGRDGFVIIPITESYAEKAEAAAEAANRPIGTQLDEENSLNGHAVLTEEKLAALLAALHGELRITPEYEAMAEHLHALSDQTRAQVKSVRSTRAVELAERRAALRGREEAVADRSRDRVVTQALTQAIIDRVLKAGDEGVKLRELTRSLTLNRKIGPREDQIDFIESIEGLMFDHETGYARIDPSEDD